VITFDHLQPGSDGLVTAVVADADTSAVLMVGHMDAEALSLTQSSGFVHFWSRSRSRLWKKGETSGNTLETVDVSVDCDGDALLVRARPSGPVCHTGRATCFGEHPATTLGTVVDRLASVIADRAAADPEASYTARLLSGGDLVARKVIEEAGEVSFAYKDVATSGPPERVVEEAADLLYHLLVLLAAAGTDADQLGIELASRMLPTPEA
jgi:phosphoribosyl-ATP pyrophosphohydrolase/phosphoribosyl-AMP cyclohydrolase